MNKILWQLSLLVFACHIGYSQGDDHTISGYIRDAANGETIIGANVYIDEIQSGTVSNEYGFYSVNLPEGTYTLMVSYVGFDSQIEQVNLNQDIKLDIEIGVESQELQEVVISSEAANANVSNTEISVNKLDIGTIKKIPTLLGEVEILRSIQLLPGVSTVGEGATGFNVRGGSIDQNLVLLDEAPVYNSSHLFGFFSVFNPDAVKDVKLYKGGIPARYGGRLSSILDVRMKEGNNKNFAFNGGVGAIFSRLAIEGPIVKDKASFIIAGRRSYADVLAQPFLDEDAQGSALNFHDLTLKTNWTLGEKDRLFLSGYTGRDNFRFGDDAGFNWGNATATLRWNHIYNDGLFGNVTAYYSDYDYQISFGDDSNNRFDWDAAIKNYAIKPEFTWFLNTNNQVRFGGQLIIYEFDPGNAIGVSEGEALDLSLDNRFAIESGIYVENEQTVSDKLTINYGLRLSYFNYVGEGDAFTFDEETPVGRRRMVTSVESFDQWESIQTYANLEPRLSLKYQLNEQESFKATYNRTAQYIHLLSNTAASTPVDIWTPSTNNIRPQVSDQVAIGYFRNSKDNSFEFSVETYYKRLDNLIDYVDGADLLLNPFIEGDILEGRGRAYGLEFYLRKNAGRFTGWASYTLARSERLVEGINNNEWYATRFDQTHNLSLTTFYDVSKRLDVSANFAIISGTPLTLPTTRIEQQGFIIPHNVDNARNNFRIPVYHRLDISATLQGKKNETRRWQGEWVFSVYNVYSRRNAFSIFTRQTGNGVKEAVRLSVFGNYIPAVAYNFKF
jgi:hypothetical protein